MHSLFLWITNSPLARVLFHTNKLCIVVSPWRNLKSGEVTSDQQESTRSQCWPVQHGLKTAWWVWLVHNHTWEYPRTINTQIQVGYEHLFPHYTRLPNLAQLHRPLKSSAADAVIKITSIWLPIPFGNSTLSTWTWGSCHPRHDILRLSHTRRQDLWCATPGQFTLNWQTSWQCSTGSCGM